MLTRTDERTETLQELLRAIGAQPELDPETELALCRRAVAGDDEAASRLVASNLRKVLHVARQHRGQGLPLEDLVHEGALGLLESLGRFDPDRGLRFFTYATFHVRRRMVQALARGVKTVRVPRQLAGRVRRFRRERDRLRAGGTSSPETEAVGRAVGLTAAQARTCEAFSMPFEISVDAPMGDPSQGPTRLERLATGPEERPDHVFELVEDLRELRAALALLDERDRQVLDERFGLTGGPRRTLRDLAARMNLSKERVRQLEERAKRILREHLAERRHPPEPAPGS